MRYNSSHYLHRNKATLIAVFSFPNVILNVRTFCFHCEQREKQQKAVCRIKNFTESKYGDNEVSPFYQ